MEGWFIEMGYSEKMARKEVLLTSMVISERGTIRKGPGKERTKIDTGHFLVWCFRTCKQNP